MTPAEVLARLVEAHLTTARTVRHPMPMRRRSSDVPEAVQTEPERQEIERARYEALKLEGVVDERGVNVRERRMDWGLAWVIAAGNYYGPIIDRVNAATPGVFGTSAAGTLNTTDPNANFTY